MCSAETVLEGLRTEGGTRSILEHATQSQASDSTSLDLFSHLKSPRKF